jgi:hypothetical protein
MAGQDKNELRLAAAERYAEQRGISVEDSYRTAEFRMTWNYYVQYLETGKLSRKARKRDIEAIIGKPFSKSLCTKSA